MIFIAIALTVARLVFFLGSPLTLLISVTVAFHREYWFDPGWLLVSLALALGYVLASLAFWKLPTDTARESK